MSILPKLIHCPCCDGINIKSINGITYKNEFKSLEEWSLKKLFNCRKCRTELGLLFHFNKKLLKVIWIDFFKCEDSHFYELNKLQIQKNKLKKNYKRYNEVLSEINSIQNQIRSDQTKIKIKFKLEHKGMLI
ncbi:hypothetical protein N8084_03165 [Pelagibacteraceae bacterium]|jgi:hypothetical protein|nr:hypothetical protein [Pelagibacteraceae bacterium]